MVNKVLAAYVGADLLFVATGALMLGFCVVEQNQMFNPPVDGAEAVEYLLYQTFPLTGKPGWASSVLVGSNGGGVESWMD